MRSLARFITYYKPYKGLFFMDMFCALAVTLIDLSFPQILNLLIQNVFIRSAAEIMRIMLYVAAGLLLMYIVRYFCQYFITSWGHIMGAKMESDMRQDLFDHYQRLSFSYYDGNNTGEMMSKLVSDLFDISELAHHGPENIVLSVLKITGSFIILMTINVPMTLILLAVTLAMGTFIFFKNRRMRAVFMDNRRKIAGVNAQLQDSLSGIRVVKSFANEEVERGKFSESNIKFLDSKESSYRIMGSFHAGSSFFQGLLYIAILACGGYFIAQRTLEPAQLAIYALYVGIFLNPVEVLINFTEQFQKGFSGFKRFMEVIDTVPEIKDAPDAVPLTVGGGTIRFADISFSYDGVNEVLSDFSLEVPSGKTVALVGPSGGGKSTLCALVPRFYDVQKGAVLIDGQDVRMVTLKSLREAIGIVQQDVYMFNGSIKENIAYGKVGSSDAEIVAAAKKANIHDFISALPDGYDTHVGERGTRLSGGQKQRIAIARVFLKDPEILILDEATSALDNESEKHIKASLALLSRGRTTIVIAHRLSTIRNADEIAVIDGHTVAEKGTHDELLDRDGIYARYFHMQFDHTVK